MSNGPHIIAIFFMKLTIYVCNQSFDENKIGTKYDFNPKFKIDHILLQFVSIRNKYDCNLEFLIVLKSCDFDSGRISFKHNFYNCNHIWSLFARIAIISCPHSICD